MMKHYKKDVEKTFVLCNYKDSISEQPADCTSCTDIELNVHVFMYSS